MIKYLPLVLLTACTSSQQELPQVMEENPYLPQVIVDEMESEFSRYVEVEGVFTEIPPEQSEPEVQPVLPEIQPIIEEIQVMAPETPYVFYTLTEEWYQPEGVRRPEPSTRVSARVSFNPTGADNYNIIRDEAVISRLSDSSSDYEFSFVQPGQSYEIDPATFPVIGVQAQIGDTVTDAVVAQWVAE